MSISVEVLEMDCGFSGLIDVVEDVIEGSSLIQQTVPLFVRMIHKFTAHDYNPPRELLLPRSRGRANFCNRGSRKNPGVRSDTFASVSKSM